MYVVVTYVCLFGTQVPSTASTYLQMADLGFWRLWGTPSDRTWPQSAVQPHGQSCQDCCVAFNWREKLAVLTKVLPMDPFDCHSGDPCCLCCSFERLGMTPFYFSASKNFLTLSMMILDWVVGPVAYYYLLPPSNIYSCIQ